MPPSPTPPAIGTAASSTGVITDWNTAPGSSFSAPLKRKRSPSARPVAMSVASSVPVVRIGIVADGLDLDVDPLAGLLIGADMGKSGVAAQELAAMRIHHAAARRLVELKPDRIKSRKHLPCPRQSQSAIMIALQLIV